MAAEAMQEIPVNVNAFSEDSWTTTPPEPKPADNLTPTPEPPKTEEPPAATEPTDKVDYSAYLKEKLGFESEDQAIAEIAELREFKTKGPEKLTFANDQSEKIFNLLKEGKTSEVMDFLDTQNRLEKLTTADVNENTADEIIKLNMRLKHPDLTEREIEFQFNKRFGIPKFVEQKVDELDEDFAQRKAEHESNVNEINMEKVIEAKMARPDLEKIKTELVLPDTQINNPLANQATPEETAKLAKLREDYLSKLESDYKLFEGFNTTYKDEEVELPVSFIVTDEEKLAMKEEFKTFDVDGFIGKRWFDEQGNPNVKQMMNDITLLRNQEKVFQKLINETGAKMKEHYIALKSNIQVGGNQSSTFQPNGEKSAMDQQIAYLWSQK